MLRVWVQFLDSLIWQNLVVRAMCTACSEYRTLHLEALRTSLGGEYSLFNRRGPYRITPGWQGWNRFNYRNGMMWAMWDDATTTRWCRQDR